MNRIEQTAAFFSIHSVKALENKAFSIVRGNIENTPEKIELAKRLYPAEQWHLEFHNNKIDLSPVIRWFIHKRGARRLKPYTMHIQQIIRYLKCAREIITIKDIITILNRNNVDYNGWSDIEMYIYYFERIYTE